jgi:hypothetical protein
MNKIYKRVCEKCGQEMIYSSASLFYNTRRRILLVDHVLQNILTDIINNISLKEIAIKYNTSYANISNKK